MSRHLKTRHPKVFREVKEHLFKTVNSYPRKNSTSWIKGSWVRKYCEQINESNKYRCNMCGAVLSLVHGFLGNMKRHVKSKHPLIYEKEVRLGTSDVDSEKSSTENIETQYLEDIEPDDTGDNDITTESDDETVDSVPVLNEDDPDFENKVRSLCLAKVDKPRSKSYFWKFFSVVEKDRRYCCYACKRNITIFPKNVANLKRHIRMKHKKQYSIIMAQEGGSSPVSFDKYYFDLEGEEEYKCKECGDVIRSVDDDQQVLFDHIKDNHPDQILAYQEEPLDNEEQLEVFADDIAELNSE